MNPRKNPIDFSQHPFLAIWVVMQTCDLACVHCRASAQPERHPLELTTDEGKNLIDRSPPCADFVLRSIRHTMLKGLGELGVDAFTIIGIAGHSSFPASPQYVHPTSEAMERAFESLQLQRWPKQAETTATRYTIRYSVSEAVCKSLMGL